MTHRRSQHAARPGKRTLSEALPPVQASTRPGAEKLAKYYIELNGLLMSYLFEADGKYNGDLTFQTTVALMQLVKKYEIDNMGARLHGAKTEAIPVLAGGEG
jgi:hypothetical protein